MNRRKISRFCAFILVAGTIGAGLAKGQDQTPAPAAAPYQAKFPGDPARSESEAQALGYMRVVLRAEREYKKRHSTYADSLAGLAGTGSIHKADGA